MSTPEEKAKELFTNISNTHWRIADVAAKKIAIIAVNEILKLDVWDWPHNAEYGKLFWEDVKAALEAI